MSTVVLCAYCVPADAIPLAQAVSKGRCVSCAFDEQLSCFESADVAGKYLEPMGKGLGVCSACYAGGGAVHRIECSYREGYPRRKLNECCQCHRRGVVGVTETNAGVPITWKCLICGRYVCIDCALRIPGSVPPELDEDTLCSERCREGRDLMSLKMSPRANSDS